MKDWLDNVNVQLQHRKYIDAWLILKSIDLSFDLDSTFIDAIDNWFRYR